MGVRSQLLGFCHVVRTHVHQYFRLLTAAVIGLEDRAPVISTLPLSLPANTARLTQNEQRFSPSRVVTAETKTSELFDAPMVSEGKGSVFPMDLPIDRRCAGGAPSMMCAWERRPRRARVCVCVCVEEEVVYLPSGYYATSA